MFTTRHADGHLHSRPMTMQNTTLDSDDSLGLFMSRQSDPVAELEAEFSVNVAHAPPGDACWISVTGAALLVKGGDKAKSSWSRSADTWFSGGPTDPDLAVVHVAIVPRVRRQTSAHPRASRS